MIIRFSLLLVVASLPIFLAVKPLLWLSVPILPGLLSTLGTAMLLCGFAVLIIIGLWGASKKIIRSVLGYFSSAQQAQRRLWFVNARQDQIKRLFYFKTMRVRHVNELSRKRLLTDNDRKHIRSLSRSINHDLLLIKTKLPKKTYRQLQQDNARFRNQSDFGALLTLQQKISTLA